jgi:hypothetical protein
MLANCSTWNIISRLIIIDSPIIVTLFHVEHYTRLLIIDCSTWNNQWRVHTILLYTKQKYILKLSRFYILTPPGVFRVEQITL